MTVHQALRTLVPITNSYFATGYRLGRLWYYYSEAELPLDDTYLIDNISNYCQKGLHTDPDWLCERIGFLIGMVSGSIISEQEHEFDNSPQI